MSAAGPSQAGRPRSLEAIPVALVIYLPMGVLSLVLGWWLGIPAPEWHARGEVLPLGIGSGLLVVLGSWLALRFPGLLRTLTVEMARAIGVLAWHECLALALLSGIFEELLFRGVLLPWLGLTGSSLLFGLMHVPWRPAALLWTAFALIMGVWLGWLQLRTGSLLTPVLCHGVVNALNLYWITRMPMDEEG